VDVQVADLNLDGSDEVCLGNSRLAAFFSPKDGGSLYELDLRAIRHNLLATLARRPEVYHETIQRHAQHQHVHGEVILKQAGLDRLLQYDAYPRKGLIDHFYDPRLTVTDLAASRGSELGDFVTGRYGHQVHPDDRVVRLVLQRSGQASGAAVRITKTVVLQAESDQLEAHYLLEGLPTDRPLHFAVEFNFAGMAAGADDRYFYHDGRQRAGQLQTLQDLREAGGIGLVDEWLGLDVSLALSRPGGIWAFPVQTVSQSESGFELVHQSTAVLPHWLVQPDPQGRWEVNLGLKLDVSRAEKRTLAAASA
jgi:alpha-amylase